MQKAPTTPSEAPLFAAARPRDPQMDATEASAVAPEELGPWEWGSLLDFSIDDVDQVIFSLGADDHNRPIQTAALPPQAQVSQLQHPFTLEVSASEGSLAQASVPTATNVTTTTTTSTSDGSSRVRKRDPRLVCENYLAGRVPCACPEMDEAMEAEDLQAGGAAGGGRKRAKNGGAAASARCQIPGCEADISELKGYHRRHRVCLRCANAASVALDGEAKRYCQQCGKFHVLGDFDEGKRSCRRKLERHNKRRRRRPSDKKSGVEKEDFQGSMLVEDEEEQTKDSLNGVSCESDSLCIGDRPTEADVLLDPEVHVSPFCSDSIRTGHSNNMVSSAVSNETQIEERIENQKSVISSPFCEDKATYSTVCPTGRISFKLYDWNPAEFPRRLRHQIFQWLSSMPVELEGYIRPGCIILTVFVAMPTQMWIMLSKDTAQYLRDFVNEPQCLLSGRGNIHIYLNNLIYQVLRDGTSLINVKMEVQVPKLHYVHPTFFEAGKPMEFIACGSNLLQAKFRFLVSIAGKYLENETCHIISNGKMSPCHAIENLPEDSDHQILRLNFSHSEAEIFGPAFIEVENVSGLSNFIPVLFADKHVCSELQRLQQLYYLGQAIAPQIADVGAMPNLCDALVSRHSNISELFLDIAWFLKKPHAEGNQAFFSSANIQRVDNLFRYLVQNEAVNTLTKVLHYLETVMYDKELRAFAVGACEADMMLLEKCIYDAKLFLQKKPQHAGISDLNSENLICNSIPQQTDINHHLSLTDHEEEHNEMEVEGKFTLASGTPCRQGEAAGVRQKDGTFSIPDRASKIPHEDIPLLTENLLQKERNLLQVPVKWPHDSLDFSRKNFTTRLVVFVVFSVFVCCGFCAALLHPHKAGEFVVSVRRCVFGVPKV